MPAKSKAGNQTNVQVFVRARPFNTREEAEGDRGLSQTVQINGNSCRMFNPKKDMEIVREEFVFDHCFDSTKGGATQADVYAKLGPLILDSCFAGYNACLFAYGQTGSGKTYTMMGNIDDENNKGVIPRLVSDLFERLEDQKSQKVARTFKLEASYLEIYCEHVKDLLVKDSGELQVRSTPERGVFIEGLTTHKVSNAKDVYKLLSQGAKNRATAFTNMNAHSSRSHAILTLNYTETMFASSGDHKVQTRSKTSRVYLVDLAGSERVKASGVTGCNLDEAKKINQSLTSLGRIIDILADRKPGKPCVLPVRESMLTWLLGDSLGGNSKTIMLAAVSPSALSFDETLSTLRYAARTKCIVNETSINETVDLKQIDDLRGQLDELQGLLKNQSDLENQLQTNEEKMAALQKLLEDERLAKEKSDQEQREKAEEERKALEEKLQMERDQLEQYLGQERQQLQDKLAVALSEVERLENMTQDMTREAENERRMTKEQYERQLKDAKDQAAESHQMLQDKCDATLRKVADLDAALRAQTNEKANLQALVEELQRRILDMQRDFQLKEQGWNQEMGLLQDKLERSTLRLQDVENVLREKEIDWAKEKDGVIAYYEMELTRVRSGNNAKFSEVTQEHQQAMVAMQKQSDERFQKLKDDLKEQHECELQRRQQQFEAGKKECHQKMEEERRRMKNQEEALTEELNAMRAVNKRQQAEYQLLQQQYDQCREEMEAAKAQYEEQVESAKIKHNESLDNVVQQYDQEYQRILHQQAEAVKEVYRKRDDALLEMRKKAAEDIARLRRAHGEEIAKMKVAQEEEIIALQSKVDAKWEQHRQEHSMVLAKHAMAMEEMEHQLADTQARLQAKQWEIENAESTTAGYIRDLQEKAQAQEKRLKEENINLAQKLANMHRLLEQCSEGYWQGLEQIKIHHRRMEMVRANAITEAQSYRLPPEFKFATHDLKSPKIEVDGHPPDSPACRRSEGVMLKTPRSSCLQVPSSPFEGPHGSGMMMRYRESSTDFFTPDIRRLQKIMPTDSPSKHITPKKCFEDDEDGALMTIGSFNAGDTSYDKHPDDKLLGEGDTLALF